MQLLMNSLRLKGSRMLTRTVSWRPDLKVWRRWLKPGISWIRLASGRVSRSEIIQLAQFARFCIQIGRSQGLKGLVLYLKVANVCLMQSLPGSCLHPDARSIGKVAVSRTRDGLPRIIPRFARGRIRAGDASTIRLWLTFFGVYRVMPYRGRYTVETIVQPGRPLSSSFLTEWETFIRKTFLVGIQAHTGEVMTDLDYGQTVEPCSLKAILSVSADRSEDPRIAFAKNQYKLDRKPVPAPVAGTPSSFAHRFNSARRWIDGAWGDSLLGFIGFLRPKYPSSDNLWSLIEQTAQQCSKTRQAVRHPLGVFAKRLWSPSEKEEPRPFGDPPVRTNSHGYGSDVSGRLAFLEEPAGKVRVVALVDYWTQRALKPLHDWLFEQLRRIPQDGTFDQLKPVKALLASISKETKIYSYDLSAATDRIPVAIQESILACVFGKSFAMAWKRLIVERDYWIPKRAAQECGISRKVRYSVGQPMGAYTSWAMLALTHHAMVQFSAYRAGYKGWFTRYAVLGDDIVIANDRVARKYRALCRLLGVVIGIPKSLVSTGKTCEFAKKLFFRGENISGLPSKFWAAAQGQVGVACALASNHGSGSLFNFVRALGFGFRAASGVATTRWASMPRRVRYLCVALTHPVFSSPWSFDSWLQWIWSESPDSRRQVDLSKFGETAVLTSGVEEVLVGPAERIAREAVDSVMNTPIIGDPASTELNMDLLEAGRELLAKINSERGKMKSVTRSRLYLEQERIAVLVEYAVELLDEAYLLPPSPEKATVKSEVDPFAIKVTQVAKLWEYWRSLTRLRATSGVKRDASLLYDDRD